MSAVAFVGLGTMGSPIAGRLLAAGHELHGSNDGILAGLGPGKVYVDMSTVSPAAGVELAAASRRRRSRSAKGCSSPSAAGSSRSSLRK